MDEETLRRVETYMATVREAIPEKNIQARLALAGLRQVIEVTDQHATVDLKTGLPNRRALQEQDSRQRFYISHHDVEDNRRASEKPIVGWFAEYIDLDNFKLINDAISHEQGDRVLSIFASALRLSLRPHDEIYRDGGDEFIIFAPMVETLPDDYDFSVVIKNRVKKNIAFLQTPEGSQYLPPGMTITNVDREALEVLDFTTGETRVEGAVIHREVILDEAEARMRELKGVGR